MIPDLRHHKTAIIVILVCIAFLCLFVVLNNKFSSDIIDMLPENSSAAKMLRYLNEENISGRFTLELRLRDNCSDYELLPEAVNELKRQLKNREIISVFTGFDMPRTEILSKAYRALPSLVDKSDMEEIAVITQDRRIDKAMHRNFIRLAAPGGLELYRFIQEDPLGFNGLVMKKLKLFSQILAYKTYPGSTLLIGADQRRAMIILETNIPVSNSKTALNFIAYLEGLTDKLPEQIEVRIICGHKHTIDNEKTIASDILKISSASLIIFFLLFFVIYRRSLASFLIILLPLFAVLISVTLMTIFMKNVSAFVIGMGGVMAGISVDYGIHIYVLCCKTGCNRVKEIRRIVRPLFGGAFTTMAIFIAFLFSGVNTYIQLGVFAILCIAISLFLSLYILPNLLPDIVKQSIIKLDAPVFKTRTAFATLLTWSIIFLSALILTFTLGCFDSTITSLDAAGKDAINNEKDFAAYWNKQEMPAILAIRGNNLQEVLQSGERLASFAKEYNIQNFISPVILTPSDETIRKNSALWKNFWTEEKIVEVSNQIIAAGVKNGFRPNAFFLFNKWLSTSSADINNQPGLIEEVKSSLLKFNGKEWILTSFMLDSKDDFEKAEKIQIQIPALRIISPFMLRNAIGTEALTHLQIIGIASFICMFLASIAVTGSIVLAVISLLPVITALAVICGFSALFNLPLTIPSCVAMIIIIGLSIDYGIFMVFRCFKSLENDVMSPITLCALTTVAGASSLLFASHPIMFKLGFTLLAGIIISYLTAVTLIPAIASIIKHKSKSILHVLILISAIISFSGCNNLSQLPEPAPLLGEPVPQSYNPPSSKWTTVSTLTFYLFGNKETLLCAGEFDSLNESGSIVFMQPAGIKIFETSFVGDNIIHSRIINDLEEKGLKAEDIISDIRKISFNNTLDSQPGIVYEFDKNSGMLTSKKLMKNNSCLWKISFGRYRLVDEYSVPYEIRLDSYRPVYSLIIKVKDFSLIQK